MPVSVRREAVVVAVLTCISALAIAAAFGLLTSFQARPFQPLEGIHVSPSPVAEVSVTTPDRSAADPEAGSSRGANGRGSGVVQAP